MKINYWRMSLAFPLVIVGVGLIAIGALIVGGRKHCNRVFNGIINS